VIQGNGQLLADTISDPKQAAEIREVLQAADRARALTRELLSQSRQHKAAANAGPADSKDSAACAAGARKVLVIEDQAAVRALVRRILAREGFGVLEADESRSAERLFDEHRADIALVIADVGIPGEKGPALFRRLASKKPELKVVYMSGHVEETALSDVPPAAGHRFLAKPFTGTRLISVVKEVLSD
jgi:two-component system cell cycle sensor histidine kinase/response regulator CckA